MATEILVPTLGESVSTATVARWLKKAGEAVAADEALVELETDKVTVEVNAPSAGVLEAIAAQEGAEVEPGALLGSIAAGVAAAAPKPAMPAVPSTGNSAAKPAGTGAGSIAASARAAPPGATGLPPPGPHGARGAPSRPAPAPAVAASRAARRPCRAAKLMAENNLRSPRRSAPARPRTAASPRATCWTFHARGHGDAGRARAKPARALAEGEERVRDDAAARHHRRRLKRRRTPPPCSPPSTRWTWAR
jgi:2-oxoglutarate dehydrogenase E2 component (dihydrolipoamide succinyltransferase)